MRRGRGGDDKVRKMIAWYIKERVIGVAGKKKIKRCERQERGFIIKEMLARDGLRLAAGSLLTAGSGRASNF